MIPLERPLYLIEDYILKGALLSFIVELVCQETLDRRVHDWLLRIRRWRSDLMLVYQVECDMASQTYYATLNTGEDNLSTEWKTTTFKRNCEIQRVEVAVWFARTTPARADWLEGASWGRDDETRRLASPHKNWRVL